jgi:hypothetical protein
MLFFKRGWTVSAIARDVERDRKTGRSYLAGERVAGVRRPAVPDALADYRAYVAARFVDDPHLWATALYEEVVGLGYGGSHVSFARQVRLAGLRPHCDALRFGTVQPRSNLRAIFTAAGRRAPAPAANGQWRSARPAGGRWPARA